MSPLGIPVLLCCLTMAAILAALHVQNLSKQSLAKRRLMIFRIGGISGAVGLLVIAASFVDPFPLTQQADGSFSNSWLDRAWNLAALFTFTSAAFALFGLKWPAYV